MYEPGDILGGCRLLKECGSGAFGTVFLAENVTTRRHFALKILPKAGRRCERELAALTAYQEKCRHTNLMRIYHVGQNDDCLFYTMDAADPLEPQGDYVPDTLGNRLRRRKRLDPGDIRTMLSELLDGLESLHDSGLLHRDIKPDNVLWVAGHAVLGDIGLVTEAEGASFAGTRGFISPAVWKGERSYSARDDLYALAMTLYCALTGNEPKGNLELPLSLTLCGCADLIRAYNAVLDEESAIGSVSDLRAVLKRPDAVPDRSALHRLMAGIVLLVFVFAVWLTWRNCRPTREAVPRDPSLPAAPQVPAKSDAQKAAELASRLEKEWRDHCRQRLERARMRSVIDISQGGRGGVTRPADGGAAARSAEIRRRIEEEETHLPDLKVFARIAVKYFGDVSDDEAPAVRALKRYDAALGEQTGVPFFRKMSYADYLIARSLGWPVRPGAKIEDFKRRVDALPAGDRRLWIRRAVFERLRETSLNGENLLRKDIHGFLSAGELDRCLSSVSGGTDAP